MLNKNVYVKKVAALVGLFFIILGAFAYMLYTPATRVISYSSNKNTPISYVIRDISQDMSEKMNSFFTSRGFICSSEEVNKSIYFGVDDKKVQSIVDKIITHENFNETAKSFTVDFLVNTLAQMPGVSKVYLKLNFLPVESKPNTYTADVRVFVLTTAPVDSLENRICFFVSGVLGDFTTNFIVDIDKDYEHVEKHSSYLENLAQIVDIVSLFDDVQSVQVQLYCTATPTGYQFKPKTVCVRKKNYSLEANEEEQFITYCINTLDQSNFAFTKNQTKNNFFPMSLFSEQVIDVTQQWQPPKNFLGNFGWIALGSVCFFLLRVVLSSDDEMHTKQ